MLVYYFVEIPVAYPEAEARLLGDLDRLPELAAAAYRHGVGLVGAPRPKAADLTTQIEIGSTIRRSGQTILPIVWRARGQASLFHDLDADLTLAPLGPRSSQLAIRGSCDLVHAHLPDGPEPGEAARRQTEATIKRFTDRLGADLRSPPRPDPQ